MYEVPVSRQEEGRLAALKLYDILDTQPEQEFDNLAQFAAEICKTPIAAISFIDEKRVWFKSRIGLKIAEMPRETSFCRFTMLKDDIFEVSDPLSDNRFDKNILVSGEQSIRYYAGIPLINKEGYRIGTLSVMSQYPNKLNEHQKISLKILRSAVMAQLESKREEKEAQFFLEALYQVADVAMLDSKLNYEKVNTSFCELAELNESAILGKNQAEIHLADINEEQDAAIFNSLTHKTSWKGKVKNLNKKGTIY